MCACVFHSGRHLLRSLGRCFGCFSQFILVPSGWHLPPCLYIYISSIVQLVVIISQWPWLFVRDAYTQISGSFVLRGYHNFMRWLGHDLERSWSRSVSFGIFLSDPFLEVA